MNANKALWEKGDFTRIAATMREAAPPFVATLGVTPGMKVLDLGCGDGTTAVPAARLGADVLGVDIARNLVKAGNRRAQAEGLSNLRFQEGDACHLEGLEDDRFDLVVSIFGAMFAPRPLDVAREMVRVTRRGGRIVMGNWIPGDPTLVAQVLRISTAYLPPPPPEFVSPMLWGKAEEVASRFGAAGVPREDLTFSRETFVFHAPQPPAGFLQDFIDFYGPTMNAFDAAQGQGRGDAFKKDLRDLFERCNESADPKTSQIPATFLRIDVRVN